MAAITSINLPHVSGWTNHANGGFQNDGSGNSQPTSYAGDRGAVYDTLAAEDSTDWTTGKIFKAEFAATSGWTAGAVWHLIYDFIDWNNYRYVKIKWGSLVRFSDVKDDEVELWKVVSGSHVQVTPHGTLQNGLLSLGHLRHYRLKNRDTSFYPAITIITAKDQHIVKASMFDTYPEAFDRHDRIILKATDPRATTNGKVGLYSVAGSQSVVVKACKSQLVTLKWTDPVSGNDANSGSHTAPYKTLSKQIASTLANQYAFTKAGTIVQSIGNYVGTGITTITVPSGATSNEDMPCHLTYSDHVVTWRANGANCWTMKGAGSTGVAQRIRFDGYILDANGAEHTVYLWGQEVGGQGKAAKYNCFGRCTHENATGGSTVAIPTNVWHQGPAPWDVPPTVSDWEQYNEFHDSTVRFGVDGGGSPQGCHGFYIETGKNLVEYSTVHGNNGAAGKFYYGTATGQLGVKMTRGNVGRHIYGYNNDGGGWTQSADVDCYVHDMLFEDSGNGATAQNSGGALIVWNGSENLTAYNIVSNNVGKNGSWASIHIACSTSAAPIVNMKLFNLTVYNSPWHGVYALITGSGAITTGIAKNIVSYLNAGDEFNIHVSADIAMSNNWQDSDGNPLFESLVLGSENFHLQSGSPLIGAGFDASAYVGKDYDGKPLPQGLWHIGAYAPESSGVDIAAINRQRLSSFPRIPVFA